MNDKEVGSLYLSLGLDLSEFNRGFADAGKIAAENMAKLQKELREIFGEIKRLDSGMHEAGSWTAEDLTKQSAKTLIKPDAEDLKIFQKAVERYKKQLADVQVDLQFGDDKFGKARAKLDSWYAFETERFKHYEEGQLVVAELYSAKLVQIEQEHADQIKQYWQNAADIEYSMTHTAFEKQLRDIELWKEAKIKAGEETAAIIANAAAKEAEAFEREVDRIKGKVQSLEDKIFEQEHSQYEADLRKLQQERIRLYEEGANSPEQIERYYQNALNKLKTRAAKGGDYTKAPEGTLQRGSNNIVVIGADQIIDDGLKRANIGVMVDENRIRAQVSQGLSQQAKDLINATQATQDLTDAQKQLVQQASGFQLIEGDTVTNAPQIQEINGDQFVSELQQFGDAIQQTTTSLEQSDTAQKIAQAESALAETLNQAATDFPADYFKTLADNMKGVSDVMIGFTNDLIDAHGRLKNAFQNTPQGNGQMQTGGFQQLPTDSFQRLSTSTQDLSQAQDLLARRTRELETLPTPKADDLKFGFDWDVFGGVGTAALAGLEFLTAIGSVAPHPGAKLLALGGAAGIAALTGSYDATNEQPDERLKPYIETDLSGIITPLTAIDQKFDSLLQQLQSETADNSFAYLGDILSEKLGALPNIEHYAQEISQAVQTIELPTEIIVTPLNNINGIVAQILSALQNRQPPSITVSPNIDIDLGGAYVFDDALKKALVGDITSDVVVSIKDAVQQATSKSSYGYGA